MIRTVGQEDAYDIAMIYNHYVENTTITFETNPVSTGEMRDRISVITEKYPYLVYEESGKVVGYCYASLWKKREAYRRTVESTVYINTAFQGKSIGRMLMENLIDELRAKSFHAIIACIAIPNPSSIKFHEKIGFRQVSEFKEVGYKFGRWLNVGDWELLL
ncbi:MAG: GNAT family N-acetyltransferase [Tannerella sp.]|jgi:phosphinothricin acetyltransferase|nr:GNAT family N-acetyltransferase [Tannerella sp.]